MRKKPIMAAALIVLLGVAGFCAGTQDGATDDQIVLQLWPQPGFSPDSGTPELAALYGELYDRFEELNPSIKIEYQVAAKGPDGLQALLAAAGEGNLPDAGNVDGFWVPRLVARGALQPLNDLWPASDRADFMQEAIDAVTFDGNIYAVWFYNAWRGLVYRGDLLKQAGFDGTPPTERDAYIQFAQELSTDGRVATMHAGANGEASFLHMMGYFWGYGGELVDSDGRPVFHEGKNREALIRTFQWYDDMVNKYEIMPEAIITMDEGAIREFFYDESTYSVTQSSSHLLRIGRDRPDLYDDLIVSNFPMEEGYRGVPHLVGWNWGIFTDDPERQRAAWKFLEWITNSENLERINLAHGHLPVRRSIAERAAFYKDDPVFSQVMEIVFGGPIRERPAVPVYPTISEAIRSRLPDVLTGSLSIEEAIDAAAEASLADYERLMEDR